MEENNNSEFHCRYRANEQAEIEKIRKKYTFEAKDRNITALERMKMLDRRVTNKASCISLCIGTLGALTLGLGMSLIMTELGKIIGLTVTMSYITGLIIGTLGMIGVILAYPIYKLALKRCRRRAAPEILKLADEMKM